MMICKKQGADMVVAGYPIAEYEGTPERVRYDEMGQEIADAWMHGDLGF